MANHGRVLGEIERVYDYSVGSIAFEAEAIIEELIEAFKDNDIDMRMLAEYEIEELPRRSFDDASYDAVYDVAALIIRYTQNKY